MNNENTLEYLDGDSRDQVQKEVSDEIRENEILGQPGWKFQSRDELVSTLKEYFLLQGYALSIRSSRKDKYVNIGCDRGGRYRNNWHIPMEHRKKKTGTRLIDCPFGVRGKKLDDELWIVEVKNNLHNHDPSSDMLGHPSCRHLSKEEIKNVEELTRSGITPRQILSSLRQKNTKLQAVSRTIYNMKAKLMKESLAGCSVIQALLEELRQGDFIYDIVHDNDGHLTHLFFAHPSSTNCQETI